ncbi:MAG TPA: type II toxin-antitoxin system VapC family toxin [Roseiarcus sp.]|jgi:ribonuclease VapC
MFIDASAIVAILNGEPEGDALVSCIESASEALMFSPLVRFEAIVSLARAGTHGARLTAETLARASAAVDLFLEEIEAAEVIVTPEIGRLAVDASARFGKVVGHPAALNFGDCFAYACARRHEQALLFIGGDFSKTDLASALNAAP